MVVCKFLSHIQYVFEQFTHSKRVQIDLGFCLSSPKKGSEWNNVLDVVQMNLSEHTTKAMISVG